MKTKMTRIEGCDRQHAAAILLARLGPSLCWFHQLMDFANRDTGLHGTGPTLVPFANVKGRPVYSITAIREFIERAQKFDPSLGPHRPRPITYEVPEAALVFRPRHREFRATPVPAR